MTVEKKHGAKMVATVEVLYECKHECEVGPGCRDAPIPWQKKLPDGTHEYGGDCCGLLFWHEVERKKVGERNG